MGRETPSEREEREDREHDERKLEDLNCQIGSSGHRFDPDTQERIRLRKKLNRDR